MKENKNKKVKKDTIGKDKKTNYEMEKSGLFLKNYFLFSFFLLICLQC